MVKRSRSVLDGFLAIGVKTLHQTAGEYELVQLQDHLVNVCGVPFHTGLLYGHGLVFPRNGSSVKCHQISCFSRCKAAQNPSLAIKLNQAISFHSLVHSYVPGQNLDTVSSLPNAYPPIPGAYNLCQANRKHRGRIPHFERFEHEELVMEMAADRGQAEFCLSIH
jgi:hypothetical protein